MNSIQNWGKHVDQTGSDGIFFFFLMNRDKAEKLKIKNIKQKTHNDSF